MNGLEHAPSPVDLSPARSVLMISAAFPPLGGCEASKLTPYSRVELTGKLAEVLNSLCGLPAATERVPERIHETCGA